MPLSVDVVSSDVDGCYSAAVDAEDYPQISLQLDAVNRLFVDRTKPPDGVGAERSIKRILSEYFEFLIRQIPLGLRKSLKILSESGALFEGKIHGPPLFD